MSKFRLAVNDRRTEETLFLNVLCFGKMAESLNEHLTKGRLISVQGKIKVDEYEDKNGNPRNSVCVMADEISLGPNPNGQGSPQREAVTAVETVAEGETPF
jgi:single-strand DNA-binding protein